MGLGELVQSVRGLHRDTLLAASSSIEVNRDLSGRLTNTSSRGEGFGLFYEALTACLYLGYLPKKEPIDTGDDYILIPDIRDVERKIVWEAKGGTHRSRINLLDYQTISYKRLQLMFRDNQVLFALYRTYLKKVRSKYKGTLDNLFESLSEQTAFSLVLSLSILVALHDYRKRDGLVYRYDLRRGFETCTCISAKTVGRLLTEPETVLRDLGLNPRDYEITRWKSPPRVSISGYKVKRFPIVRILDKDHEKWLRKFVKESDGKYG